MEAAKMVKVHRKATAVREYDAITVCIGDLHLSCDLVNERQFTLAKRLAEDQGCEFVVAPELASWSVL